MQMSMLNKNDPVITLKSQRLWAYAVTKTDVSFSKLPLTFVMRGMYLALQINFENIIMMANTACASLW